MTGAPDFVAENGGTGPRGFDVTDAEQIEIGDVIQLQNSRGEFYHSLLISEITDDDILVCAHSDDALDRPISTYNFTALRVIHIENAAIDIPIDTDIQNVLDGTALPMPRG